MANTYLRKAFSTTGNRQKFTLSMWIKRGSNLGAEQMLCECYSSGSAKDEIWLQSNDTINYVKDGGLAATTSAVFRDTFGWYNLVMSGDSTQGSNADRIKMYINGVQQTLAQQDTIPQNQNFQFGNTGTNLTFGMRNATDWYFNGSMSHIHMVDGTAYPASTFGSTDATTGEWKINTSPSVTYGTNGFTILKDGNTITDQSANSNDFTLGGGTLTNTEDCPDNVFATFNSITPNSNNLQSGGTRYANNSGGWDMRNGTLAATSGKFYAEFKITSAASSGDNVFGIIDINQFDDYGKNCNFSRAYCYRSSGSKESNNSASSFGASFGVNDIIGIAMDLDNNKVYASINSVWQNSGDPTSGSTGTGAMYSITDGYDYTFTDSSYDSGTDPVHDANFGNGYFGPTAIASEGSNASGIGKFEYDVPTGYTALSTKGLNI